MSVAKSKSSVFNNRHDIWCRLDLSAPVIIFDCSIAALFDFSHLKRIKEKIVIYVVLIKYIITKFDSNCIRCSILA